jgi:hypothetical protein
MTQPQLFIWLFTTLLLAIGAVREFKRGNGFMGATLAAVPTAGWLSYWLGMHP